MFGCICVLCVVCLIDDLQEIRPLWFEQAFHLHREKNTAIKQLWMLPWRVNISEDARE